MPNYDFKTLSGFDFECLNRDLLQKHFNITLESFKSGRDSGIDLRYSKDSSQTMIVQCKHYANTNINVLYSNLKNVEIPKIIKLNPRRYVLATSLGLTPDNKERIKSLLSPYIESTADIFGQTDINNLLGIYPDVEKAYLKLWLNSAAMLAYYINKNIYNQTDIGINRINNNIKLYVQNESFNKAMKILDEYNYCIISGIPGIGKSILGEMLVLSYLKNDYEVVFVVRDIQEAIKLYSFGKKQVFYYDDFLGQTHLEATKLNKNEDRQLVEFIEAIGKSNNMKFILTTREYILKQVKNSHELFSRTNIDIAKCIIDPSSYTRMNKAKILYNHIYYSELPRSYIEQLLSCEGYLKIIDHKNYNPRIISMMTDTKRTCNIVNDSYYNTFIQYIDNPLEIWKHAFDNQISDSSRNVLIVMASLPANIRRDILEDSFMRYLGVSLSDHDVMAKKKDFYFSLQEIEETFIRIDIMNNVTIIGFHNPSCRDYLENIILTNEHILKSLLVNSICFQQVLNLWNLISTKDEIKREYPNVNILRLFSDRFLFHIKDSDYIHNYHMITIEERLIFLINIQNETNSDVFEGIIEIIFSELIDDLNKNIRRPYKLIELLELLNSNNKYYGHNPLYIYNKAREYLERTLDGINDFYCMCRLLILFGEYQSTDNIEDYKERFINISLNDAEAIIDSESDPSEINDYIVELDYISSVLNVDIDEERNMLEERKSLLESRQDENDDDNYEMWRDIKIHEGIEEEEIHSLFECFIT